MQREGITHVYSRNYWTIKIFIEFAKCFSIFFSRIEIAEKIEQLFASACNSNIIHDAKIYEKQ